MRNSRSRCGCGGAQVFECVDAPMPTIERRRLTLDDRDDRRRDRSSENVQRSKYNFLIRLLDANKNLIRPLDAKRKSYRRRRHEEEPNEREPETTRQNKDVMNECSWIVSFIVLEVSPGGPSDTPSWTPRKPPRRARGLLGPKIVQF